MNAFGTKMSYLRAKLGFKIHVPYTQLNSFKPKSIGNQSLILNLDCTNLFEGNFYTTINIRNLSGALFGMYPEVFS